MQEAEFVRGNQKSYIRIPCSTADLQGSDYQMCSYNKMKSLLEVQQRSQNGKDYLYYEISGMQSLDVYLQTQKLRRSFALLLAQAIIDLCKEVSEYALDIQRVMLLPKYVMMEMGGEEIRFVYCFDSRRNFLQEMEQLLENCIEYLDYQDEQLMELMYGIYERFLEQQENFALKAEMEAFCKKFTDLSEKVVLPNAEYVDASNIFELNDATELDTKKKLISIHEEKEDGNLRKGIIILLLVDIGAMFLWKPITLLKLFFGISTGVVLLVLQLYLKRRNKYQREEKEREEQEELYLEEYGCIAAQVREPNHYTQIIEVQDSEGTLYNLQECEPKCIYINNTQKIIGKASDKVQVQILQEGISRIHARVQKEGGDCIVEDLNSTNGTWVNGKILEPRSKYVLKQGDKVRFAGVEYIFR